MPVFVFSHEILSLLLLFKSYVIDKSIYGKNTLVTRFPLRYRQKRIKNDINRNTAIVI